MARNGAVRGGTSTPAGKDIITYRAVERDVATDIVTYEVRVPWHLRYMVAWIGGNRPGDLTPPQWDRDAKAWRMTGAALDVLLRRCLTPVRAVDARVEDPWSA